MSDIAFAAQTVMDRYATAVQERNVAAFMSLYAPTARIYDAWDVWEYRNTNDWQKPISAWLDSHPDEQLKVTFNDVTVSDFQACVAVSAFVVYARISADGALLGGIQNRLTWLLHVDDANVRVIHEHTSVPVDFHDMKPLLRRELPDAR